ncbi:class I SAM-dependent methyltransferase [Methylohalobius crimeensis]|uniref:class I SAM-dependent methyltransferase n=1 Tax=Methylohalobius crimeensis TaxID=244365 RepID=UPI0003B77DB6|nr:class I SAM-dependent methyltransferase [Methylohalobius crimeensis]
MFWIIFILLIILISIQIYIGLKLKYRFCDQDRRFEKIESKLLKATAKQDNLANLIHEKSVEIQNSSSLLALDLNYPVFFGDWSIDSHLAKFIVQHLSIHKPKCILEIGSGSSTILIGKIAKILGYSPKHIAIDHDIKYLEATKVNAKLNNLNNDIDFIHLPLEKINLSNKEFVYYKNLPKSLIDNRPDLIIVDGPPANTCKHARLPALPIIYNYISDNAVIVLDDYCRQEEKEIVDQWMNQYHDFDLETIQQGHQCAILKRKKS